MRNKTKKYISFLLAISIVLCIANDSYAHDNADAHNKELRSVLFEKGYSIYQSTKIKNYVIAIEYASYLTVDQFGGKGEEKFNQLKKWHMGGLPLQFTSIDYSNDLSGNGKKIEAKSHRKNTHQGWDIEYGTPSANRFWTSRRNVLLGTLNTIFAFRNDALVLIRGYDQKCNSLAGIVYYVHLLGDYKAAKSYTNTFQQLTDLAGHEDTDKNDMISSLRSYATILFADQTDATEYKNLMKGFDSISKNAGKIIRSIGGVNSDEEFAEYKQYAEDLLTLLQNNIPPLLKREEFFKTVFYPNNY